MPKLNPREIIEKAGVEGLVLDDLLDEISKFPPKEILDNYINQYNQRLSDMEKRKVSPEIIIAYRSLLKEITRTYPLK